MPYDIQLHDVIPGNVIGSAPAEWVAFPGSFFSHVNILCKEISWYRGSHKHSKLFCTPCFLDVPKQKA